MSIAIEKNKNPQSETAKHTPGPWFVTGTRVFHETADAEPAIAETGGEIDSSVDESKAEANAKLIAAAPELLEALRDAHTLLLALRTKVSDADAPLINSWIKDARTVIAKTE